jgi:predicted HicB family RNase H-like nuclease
MKKKMKIAARDFLRVIEWSEEDGCYVGSAPPLIGRCCHGTSETQVVRELARIVEEWIAIHQAEKRTLPAPTNARKYSGKFVLRVPPPVHQALALRAQSAGQSLNAFCAERLASAV